MDNLSIYMFFISLYSEIKAIIYFHIKFYNKIHIQNKNDIRNISIFPSFGKYNSKIYL